MRMRRLVEDMRLHNWLAVALDLAIVVVGIFLGLQVTSWNEDRLQRIAFREAVERVYTGVKKDRFNVQKDRHEYLVQIRMIRRLLDEPAKIADDRLLDTLIYVDLPGIEAVPLAVTTIKDQAAHLMRNANSPAERELANQVNDYVAGIGLEQGTRFAATLSNVEAGLVAPLLAERGIAQRTMIWGMSANNEFSDYRYAYSARDVETARSMLGSGVFETPLRLLLTRKNMFDTRKLQEVQATESLMQKIRSAYPDVRLQFTEMGMIGTALADASPSAEVAADCADFTNDPSCIRGWTNSTPMTRVAGFDARWTLDVKLQDGHLKFRTRNSWEENWGGGGFPKGPAIWYGENIRVAAGHYRVTIDLETEFYDFERLPGS